MLSGNYIAPEWKVENIITGFKALYIDESYIYGFKRGWLCRADLNMQNLVYLTRFDILTRIFSCCSRILERVLRLAPSAATKIGDKIYIVQKSKIWEYSITNNKLQIDFVIPEKRKALNITSYFDGQQNILIFGEYFSNPDRLPVNIWKKAYRTNWTIAATFPTGVIEHVHTIIKDASSFLILTGDFGNASGIWRASLDLSDLTPLFTGKQEYRATWALNSRGKLIYATDTQLEINYLVELDLVGRGSVINKMKPIDGSSIYYGQSTDTIFFSTTVEAGKPSGVFLKDMFDCKRGPGIVSNHSCVYEYNTSCELKLVFMSRKDFLPSRLAQFGTFTFPNGNLTQDTVCLTGQALSYSDNNTYLLKRVRNA